MKKKTKTRTITDPPAAMNPYAALPSASRVRRPTEAFRPVRCLVLLLLLSYPWVATAQSERGANDAFLQETADHRDAYRQGFLDDPRSPLAEKDLDLLRFFPPDPRFRVEATFERTPGEKPFDLPTYSGKTKPFVQYGILRFAIGQDTFRLAVYQSMAARNLPAQAQHLFLPFRDLTNEEETYGGGRYLDILLQDLSESTCILDFNKCYNPWCHYSDGYNCPIPPAINRLPTAIRAGEMKWAGETKSH
jgi:uncharacterized protein (DUF1684 family)